MNNFPGGSSDESDEIEELPKESLLLNLKVLDVFEEFLFN